MAVIQLNASSIANIKSKIRQMENEAENSRQKVSSALMGLDFEVAAKENIRARLTGIKNSLNKQENLAQRYGNAFVSVTNQIMEADSRFGQQSRSIVDIITGYTDNIIADISRVFFENKFKKIAALSSLFLVDESISVTSVISDIWKKGKEVVDNIGDSIKYTYGKVVKATSDCISWVKESYESKGIVYTVAQYGKAAVKIGFGVAAAAGALATIVGTAGGSIPLAAVSLTYAVNDIASGIKDTVDITSNLKEGKTAEIEENDLLKDGTEFIAGGVGGAVGEMLGDAELGEEIGEKIGAGVYGAGNLVNTVYDVSTGIDSLKQVADVDWSKIGGEMDEAVKGAKHLLNTNVGSELKYQMKLLSYEMPNTMTAIENASLLKDVAGGAKSLAEGVIDIIKGDEPAYAFAGGGGGGRAF